MNRDDLLVCDVVVLLDAAMSPAVVPAMAPAIKMLPNKESNKHGNEHGHLHNGHWVGSQNEEASLVSFYLAFLFLIHFGSSPTAPNFS